MQMRRAPSHLFHRLNPFWRLSKNTHEIKTKPPLPAKTTPSPDPSTDGEEEAPVLSPKLNSSIKGPSSSVSSSSGDFVPAKANAIVFPVSKEPSIRPPTGYERSQPRQESSFDNDEPLELVSDSTVRQRHYLQELTNIRDSLIGTRISVRQRRRRLRNEREDLVDREAQFLQELRKMAAKDTNRQLEDLLARYEDIPSQRDEIHRAEYEYNIAENGLIQLEEQIDEQETLVYQRLSSAEHEAPDRQQDRNIESREHLDSDSAQLPQPVFSPLEQEVHELVSRRGLVSDRLQKLREKQADLLRAEQRSLRIATNFTETRGGLETLEREIKLLQRDLLTLDFDISDIAALPGSLDVSWCLSQFEQETSAEAPDDTGMKAVNSRDLELGTKDPLFLPEPSFEDYSLSALPSTPEKNAALGKPLKTTSPDVNSWMLNILRRSPLEILRYRATEKIRSLSLNRTQLARLVLDWWYKDGAARENKFQPQPTRSPSLASSPWQARSDILSTRPTANDWEQNRLAVLSDIRRPADMRMLNRHAMTSPG